MNQLQIPVPDKVMHATRVLGLATLEAIEIGGENGARSTVLYAAMQAQGASYNQFTSLMQGLISKGMTTLTNEHYFLTQKGKEFIGKLKVIVENTHHVKG